MIESCSTSGNTLTLLDEAQFTKWLRALNVQAAAKVATALERISDGNLSNVKPVGSGVLEYKIDFGPGSAFTWGETAKG